MLKQEEKAVILDWRNRKIISSLTELPEECVFPEEDTWRRNHFQNHYRREVMLMLSGSHSLRFRDQTFLGVPNTMLLLNSHEKHDERYFPGKGNASHLWLIIRSDFINCQVDEIQDDSFLVKYRYIYKQKDIIRKLNQQWDMAVKKKISAESGIFALQTLINEVLLDMLNAQKELHCSGINVQSEVIDKACSYLDSTNGRGCSISFLASLTGYSETHFSRIFRNVTGMRPGEYINECRKKRYLELVRLCPLKMIAEELGFSSVNALCNWRRRHIK